MAFLSVSQLLAALLVAFVSVRLTTLGPRSHTQAVAYRMANGTLPTPLVANERIQQLAQQHFKGQIVAPEHFAFHPDGDIYFGQSDDRMCGWRQLSRSHRTHAQGHRTVLTLFSLSSCGRSRTQACTTVASCARVQIPRRAHCLLRRRCCTREILGWWTAATRAAARRARRCVAALWG